MPPTQRNIRSGHGQMRLRGTQSVGQQPQQPQNGALQPSPQVQQAVNAVDMAGEIHITMEEAKGPSVQPGQVESSIAQSLQSLEALGQSMGPHIEGM